MKASLYNRLMQLENRWDAVSNMADYFDVLAFDIAEQEFNRGYKLGLQKATKIAKGVAKKAAGGKV